MFIFAKLHPHYIDDDSRLVRTAHPTPVLTVGGAARTKPII